MGIAVGTQEAEEVWKRGMSRILFLKSWVWKRHPFPADVDLWRIQMMHKTRAVSFDWTELGILFALEQAKRWPCLLGKDLQGTGISLRI